MSLSFRRPGTLGIAALAACAVAFALTGCSAAEAAGPDTSAPMYDRLPESIRKAGEISVASNVEYPPFESFAEDGTTVVGIDRDIADALEKQLGVPMKFNHIAFDAIVPGLTSKRYDMGMSAMSDTLIRQKEVNFVDYYMSGGNFLDTAANPTNAKTLMDVCGMHVGVVKGTSNDTDVADGSAACVAAGKDPIEVTVYPGQSQAVLALKSGRIPTFIVDTTAGGVVAAESNGEIVLGARFIDSPFGIVFSKDSEDLMKLIKEGMEALKKDGTYDKILADYDQSNAAVEEFIINGATK